MKRTEVLIHPQIFCSGIDGCRLTVENKRQRRPLPSSPPPTRPAQRKQSRQEAIEENS